MSWNFAVNCFSAASDCASPARARSDSITPPACAAWLAVGVAESAQAASPIASEISRVEVVFIVFFSEIRVRAAMLYATLHEFRTLVAFDHFEDLVGDETVAFLV